MAKPARPTIADLAELSGVSVATVDRVLNGRAPVKGDTARKVLAAAEALDFHATALLRRRLDAPPAEKTLAFLLQKGSHSFYHALGHALTQATRAATAIRGRPLVHFLDDLGPAAVQRRLEDFGQKADALAIVAADHPKLSGIIERLHGRGVPVFALLSDLTAPARAGFVGIDHRKAGRTAAWAVTRLARRPGPIGVFVGSHRYLGHELSETSFRSYVREHAPAMPLLETRAIFEDIHFAHEATLELLRLAPDLAGLYVAGGGIEGVIEALGDVPAPRRPILACNELTPETRAALLDNVVDLVIATPVDQFARWTIDSMVAALQGSAPPARPTFLPFDIHIAENV